MLKEKFTFNSFGLLLGIFVFAFLFIFKIDPSNIAASNMAAIASLMAIWWMTEAIPIAATSLLPVILYPVLGIMSSKDASVNYMNSTIMLFLGGFLIAVAMERWDLHKRVALTLIKRIGKGPEGMITGFMMAAFFLSMFVSNTATTIMMLPIGLAIIKTLENDFGEAKTKTFSIALMLGIAYAASVGGTATLIGTVPNLAFKTIYDATFERGHDISFAKWMVYGVPTALVMFFIVRFMILKVFYKPDKDLVIDSEIVDNELKKMSYMSFEEKSVLTVLSATALLWIFRADIDLSIFTIPGWSNLFYYTDFIDDGTVAIFTAMLLFIIPSKNKSKGNLLNNKAFNKLPWDIIILFGGGFALALGFEDTGLSTIIGEQFKGLGVLHIFFITLSACLMLTFLTELTSNTATTYTMLPILASIAVSIDVEPLLIMIPATMAASYAFMLPVATPPNAIVFSSNKIRIKNMVKIGFWLNLTGVLVATSMYYLIGNFVW